jgi:hypothetical protein
MDLCSTPAALRGMLRSGSGTSQRFALPDHAAAQAAAVLRRTDGVPPSSFTDGRAVRRR